MNRVSTIPSKGALLKPVRASRFPIADRLRHRWAAFMTWAASQEAEDAISDFMLDVAPAAENILKWAVVLVALYFAIEIGSAFLHGGAVDRVLGGLR